MMNLKQLLVSVAILLPIVVAAPVTTSSVESTSASTYIITFKREAAEEDVAAHLDFARDLHAQSLQRRGLTKRDEEGFQRRYDIGDHRSYSAIFDPETLKEISAHPAVYVVERDQIYTTDDLPELQASDDDIEYSTDSEPTDEDDWYSVDSAKKVNARASVNVIIQKDATWGLTSLSLNHLGPRAPVVEKYRYYDDAQGSGIYAYVVDSGIRISHKDFEGRASQGTNFVSNETVEDFKGHGTHVAGTIGSKTYGVAKKVKLISVKVANQWGKASSANLLAGYDWVLKDAKKNNRVAKSVVNISMGGKANEADRQAMENLHKAGLAVFVSAGNNNKDASTSSPANSASIFTVASHTSADKRSDFSNYGSIVDIFAPGSDIVSLSHKSDTGTTTMSGTSMAAPHVAGVAAGVKSRYGSSMDSPSKVYERLISDSVKNIMGETKGSPNRLLSDGLGYAKDVPLPPDNNPNRPPM